MSFRILEISNPAELHIHHHQLEITENEDTYIIPVDDLDIVIAFGPEIRLSTNDLMLLAANKVLLMTINHHYLPVSMTLSFVNHSRQSEVMEKQLSLSKRKINYIWDEIIRAKIRNQALHLSLAGKIGTADELFSIIPSVCYGDRHHLEAQAAKKYFSHLFPGLNRRTDTPINSCFNYGYSILRAEIAKYAAASGFLLAKEIWHSNQYNAFNLIDDFIEPFRPMVDEAVIPVISENTKLSVSQRKALASIPFNKCIINEHETTIVNAIEIMILSIRSYILDQSDKLLLPTLLPLEHIGSIIE